jgi:hypothetical protein
MQSAFYITNNMPLYSLANCNSFVAGAISSHKTKRQMIKVLFSAAFLQFSRFLSQQGSVNPHLRYRLAKKADGAMQIKSDLARTPAVTTNNTNY